MNSVRSNIQNIKGVHHQVAQIWGLENVNWTVKYASKELLTPWRQIFLTNQRLKNINLLTFSH